MTVILASVMTLAALFFRLQQLLLLPDTPAMTILTVSFSFLFLAATAIGVTSSFMSFKFGYAYGREQALKNPPMLGEVVKPYEVKFVGLTLARRPAGSFLFKVAGETVEKNYSTGLGRKPFFDDETIRAKIHKWERRRNALPAKNQTKFLIQEFSIHPDGSLYVPLETFFLWRRRKPKNSSN